MVNSPGRKQNRLLFYILAILGILLLTSLLLALAIGFMYGKFTNRMMNIAFTNAFCLSLGVLLNLFLTRNLVLKIRNIFIGLINFFMILGIAFSGFLYVFLTESFFFLYGSHLIYTYFLINFSFALTLSFMTTGFIIYQQRMLQQEQTIHTERMLRREMEQKLFSAKLNPHFLFNALNMITSLLDHPARAEEALLNLAELLRFYLQAAEQDIISLQEEITHVEKYLSIQKLRFEEKLVYKISGPRTGRIPPMLIQPLVENSIKHNINDVKNLEIHIEISRNADKLKIMVWDSGRRVTEAMLGKGNGLSLTRRRVQLAGGRLEFKEGGVEIQLGEV